EMWTTQVIGSTGKDDSGAFKIDNETVQVSFAPGQGSEVEGRIADTIAAATDRLYIASMCISSGKILRAIEHGMTDVDDFGAIYDGGTMAGVVPAGKKGAPNPKPTTAKAKLDTFTGAQKLALWERIEPHLINKHSIQYNDNLPHNFMHDKVAVADDK